MTRIPLAPAVASRIALAAIAAMLALWARPASAQTAFWDRSGVNTPFVATYSGSTWGSASALPSIGNTGYWYAAAVKPSSSEVSLVCTNSDSKISIQIGSGTTFGSATTLISNAGSTAIRKFGVAYEQVSGDGMVIYSTGAGDSVAYRTIVNGALASSGTVFSGGNYFDCVRLYPRKGNDGLLAVASDRDLNLYARIWSGTSWGTSTTLQTNIDSAFIEAFAGCYESSTGDTLVVYNETGVNTPRYRTRTGTSWSSEGTMTACNGVPQYIRMASKPTSNEISCAILDDTKHVRVYIWNGSSWASSQEVSTAAQYTDRRNFDLDYAADGSKGMIVYSNGTATPQYRTYSGGSWSSANSMTSMGSTPQCVSVQPGASGAEIWVLVTDSDPDLNVWRWSGTAMGTMKVLEGALGGITTSEPFCMVLPSTKPKIMTWENVKP